MRIVLSRKGFDSGSGGGPSPIVDGRPLSLPIPTGDDQEPSYARIATAAGPESALHALPSLVHQASKGRVDATCPAHLDPWFGDGHAALGQCGAARSHLHAQGVDLGDVFLFFGLFRDAHAPKTDPNALPHHRFFGALLVEHVSDLDGANPHFPDWAAQHPHVLREGRSRGTLYTGRGFCARHAGDALRLTVPHAAPSHWAVPGWMADASLSYHGNPDRWSPGRLHSVARGQEFVAHVPDDPRHPAHAWLAEVLSHMDPAR